MRLICLFLARQFLRAGVALMEYAAKDAEASKSPR